MMQSQSSCQHLFLLILLGEINKVAKVNSHTQLGLPDFLIINYMSSSWFGSALATNNIAYKVVLSLTIQNKGTILLKK